MAWELKDNMRFRTSCFMLGLTFCLAGCVETPPASKDVAPLPVSVSYPAEQYVTDYADYTARTAAVDSVEVRAHVWGYLANPKTGTIRLRGVFPNKQEHLLPGFFARVRVPVGRRHRALLVSDRVLDTDQGQKILYVVNDNNEVVARPVRLGALHDGLREITEGIKPGERVIVNGLQQVRPGITVEPKLVDMSLTNPKFEIRNPKEIQITKSK